MGKISYVILKPEYRRLWDTCKVKPTKFKAIDKQVLIMFKNKERYEDVSAVTGVPWYIIAVIHSLEGSLNFKTHLHNGDSLAKRTIQYPTGRPVQGRPPFTWVTSAIDALAYDGLHTWKDWSLEGSLYMLERYNGFGYRQYHPEVLSPYLWSFTNHYGKGKYEFDGKWNPELTSSQCGAAALLKRIEQHSKLTLDVDLLP